MIHRHYAKGILFIKRQRSEVGLTEFRGAGQNGIERRGRSPCDPLSRCRTSDVAVRCFRSSADFASLERSDLPVLLGGSGCFGTWYGLRRIAALRLWHLSTSPLDQFAACSGAPFHRVPRRLSGIVACRRASPEVAYSCSSTNRYDANPSKQRLRFSQSAVAALGRRVTIGGNTNNDAATNGQSLHTRRHWFAARASCASLTTRPFMLGRRHGRNSEARSDFGV